MPSSDITKIFADRLSDLIAELKSNSKKDLKTLADEIGIPASTLSAWQNDTREAGISCIVSISQYFNVTTDWLLGVSDNRTLNAASIGNETGLSDESIEHLKLAKAEKDSKQRFNEKMNEMYSEDEKEAFAKFIGLSKYCWADVIDKIISGLIFYPEVCIDLNNVVNMQMNGIDEEELEDRLITENYDVYKKIYPNGTVLIGKNYRDFMVNKISNTFRDFINFLLRDMNPIKDENDPYEQADKLRKSGTTFKEKLQNRIKLNSNWSSGQLYSNGDESLEDTHADDPETR